MFSLDYHVDGPISTVRLHLPYTGDKCGLIFASSDFRRILCGFIFANPEAWTYFSAKTHYISKNLFPYGILLHCSEYAVIMHTWGKCMYACMYVVVKQP